LEVLRLPVAATRAGEDAVDARLRAVLHVALDFRPGGRETGPAMQVDDAAEVPRRSVAGFIRGPCQAGGIVGVGAGHGAFSFIWRPLCLSPLAPEAGARGEITRGDKSLS